MTTKPMTTIPVQRLSALDKALIEDTIARYNRSIDSGDREEYLSIFAEDAIKENLKVWGRLNGRAAILGAFDTYFSSPAFESYRGGQHRVASTIYEDVQSDRVSAWSNFIFVVPSPDGPVIAAMGVYRDIFVKQDGRWLIAQRLIESDIAPVRDMALKEEG